MECLEGTRGLWWAWGQTGIDVHNRSKHVVHVRIQGGLSTHAWALDSGGRESVLETPTTGPLCEVRLSHYTKEREEKTILLRDGGARMTVTITPMVAPSCYTKDRAPMLACIRRRTRAY
jgi:hypothetical protein